MGISSLGAGSSILTQDVLDQLRAADEAKFVAPVNARINVEDAKKAAFDVLDAYMDNVYQSLKSLGEYGVFESRNTGVSDESVVEVTAVDNSDIQKFELDITNLATKEIVQSGSFGSRTDKIADGDGKMELAIGEDKFTFDYTASTSLEELKFMIDKEAGNSVSTTIVQVSSGDFRLLLSAAETGTGQEISITDVAGEGENLKEMLVADTDTTDGITNVQTAVNANFKFNGVDIERTSNKIDDLLTGVTITLKDVGTSDVIVQQDREHIEDRITNFVDKYNSALYQLNKDTKSSQDESVRGAFSSESTIKGMRSSLINMLSTVGEGQGRVQDYGIDVGDDGRLSVNSKKLNDALNKDPDSVKSFLTGGTFTKDDGSTVELKGVFSEMETEVAKYSKYGSVLDTFKESMTNRMTQLTGQRERAVERLDVSYATMAKKFAAYDMIISQFNTASSMFSDMINAELAARD